MLVRGLWRVILAAFGRAATQAQIDDLRWRLERATLERDGLRADLLAAQELADARELQLEYLEAWQTRHLERMRTEAHVEAVRRGFTQPQTDED